MTDNWKRSRGAVCVRALPPRHCEERQRRSNPVCVARRLQGERRPKGLDCFAFARNDEYENDEYEKREAERRQTCSSTSAPLQVRRAPFTPFPPPLWGRGREGGCARLSAFHRGSCCSERTPQLSFRYALPGTWSDARSCKLQTTRFKRPRDLLAGVTRSFLSQSSEFASRRPVVMPAGRMFPKPPGSGLQSRARAPHSLRVQVCRPNTTL